MIQKCILILLLFEWFATQIQCEIRVKNTTEILDKLRWFMNGSDEFHIEPIFAYIIPTEDAHQSEYLAKRDERRAFISGFDGSAGTVVVTQSEALLWTDGRYYLQASLQMDENWTLMKKDPEDLSLEAWLSRNCKNNGIIGVDGTLIPAKAWNSLSASLENSECTLKSITPNLVDLVWGEDQPLIPQNEIIPLDLKYTGKTVWKKAEEVRGKMLVQNASVLILTALDEIAYFFNLRGGDIDYNPVFFSYSLITHNDLYLFLNTSKITPQIQQHFKANNVSVTIKSYESIFETFEDLINKTSDKIWISMESSIQLTSMVPRFRRVQSPTPVISMKAVKNEVEAQGLINCHIRDGIALVRYFEWLENEIQNKRTVTEISGGLKLAKFRARHPQFMGLSFETINGSGPNGSIIHYAPTNETDREITDKELYLCDSGGQYLDGTTDVTRTWHFGKPTAHEIEAFTRVLKGQITIATLIVPNQVRTKVLDTIARKSLWDAGLDYGHGTTHGIGHFLNVHEEPMITEMALQENMFLASEPGYYENGKFGIRIENIVQVVSTKVGNNFNGRGALTFNTITLCPIQTKLINASLLTEIERNYLNAYHKKVYDTLAPILEKPDGFGNEGVLKWLRKETLPI